MAGAIVGTNLITEFRAAKGKDYRFTMEATYFISLRIFNHNTVYRYKNCA